MKSDEIISGQSGLDGIWWALRGQRVRGMLRSAMAELLDHHILLGSFFLRRAKYKPGSRLTAYYDINLPTSQNQKSNHRSIEVDWRPDGKIDHASGPADPLEEQKEALQKEAVHFGLAAPFSRLATEIPGSGIHIQVYPLDAHFPQLVHLSNPRYVQESLVHAELIDNKGSKRHKSIDVSVTPIRYRPGERHVLRFDCFGADGQETQTSFFAKLYNTKGDGARRMRLANLVADWLEGTGDVVRAARPKAFLATDETLLYPMVPGIPLSQALRKPGRNVSQNLLLAGSAIRSLHESGASLTKELPTKTLEDEIRVIRRAAQHINILLPDTGVKISRLVDLIQELYHQLPSEAPTFTHSDLKADHLRISAQALTLIDFDTCSLADPASDIGKFLADLRFWFELYDQTEIEALHRQFLTGYGDNLFEARLLRGYLFESLILIKITIRRVPLYVRYWAERTAALIDCADRLVAALKDKIGS